jgi:hypothetical protein
MRLVFKFLAAKLIKECFLNLHYFPTHVPTAVEVACTIGTQTQDKKNRKKELS